jgi:hypothetical protein
MADEPTRISETPALAKPGKLFEHWCEHSGCQKWGGFGYARMKTDISRWFCFEHRDDGEALL